MSGTESVPDLSPELVGSLAPRRARDGGVAKVGDRYLDRGHPTPGYLGGMFDELVYGGLLALVDEDSYGFRRVSVTDAGRTRYAQLRDTPRQSGRWASR